MSVKLRVETWHPLVNVSIPRTSIFSLEERNSFVLVISKYMALSMWKNHIEAINTDLHNIPSARLAFWMVMFVL